MSRIREKTTVVRTLEAVSPVTEILWNPLTNDGTLRFNVQDILLEDGVVVDMVANTQLRRNQRNEAVIDRSISSLLSRTVEIPTGVDTTMTVPLILVMGAIKVLFDEVYVEQTDLEAAEDAAKLAAEQAAAALPPSPRPERDPVTGRPFRRGE